MNTMETTATPDPRLSVSEEVILRILQELGDKAYRTQMVKLCYLVDYIYHRHRGQTLTGFNYAWDNYGPNALNNQIVKDADALAEKGLVAQEPVTNWYGSPGYLYQATGEADPIHLNDGIAEEIVKDVVRKYRSYAPGTLAAASKGTQPFQGAQQGQILNLGVGGLVGYGQGTADESEVAALGAGKSVNELRLKYALT